MILNKIIETEPDKSHMSYKLQNPLISGVVRSPGSLTRMIQAMLLTSQTKMDMHSTLGSSNMFLSCQLTWQAEVPLMEKIDASCPYSSSSNDRNTSLIFSPCNFDCLDETTRRYDSYNL